MTALVFLPSSLPLLNLAADLEAARDHVLKRPVASDDDIFDAEQALIDAANAAEGALGEEGALPFQALGSEAVFDQVLYDAIISAPSDALALDRAKAIIAQGVASKMIDADEEKTLAQDDTRPWER